MDTEEYRKEIEEKILDIIEERLKSREMNALRAREIARYILESLHPHMTLDQIHSIAQNFDDHFQELVPIALQVINDYDERVKKLVTEHVGNLLKQNKVDEANALLKKALTKEVKVL